MEPELALIGELKREINKIKGNRYENETGFVYSFISMDLWKIESQGRT
jgi:hypothetical protein